jgi:hypothetical protein
MSFKGGVHFVCVWNGELGGRGEGGGGWRLRYRLMPKAFNGSTVPELSNCLVSLQQAETTSITVKEIKEIKHELYAKFCMVLKDSTTKPVL